MATSQPKTFCQVGAELAIVYKALDGETTTRRISVSTIFISPKGNILIGAYCYDSKAYRTFLANEIISADELYSGQRIHQKAPCSPFKALHHHLGVQLSINIAGRTTLSIL